MNSSHYSSMTLYIWFGVLAVLFITSRLRSPRLRVAVSFGLLLCLLAILVPRPFVPAVRRLWPDSVIYLMIMTASLGGKLVWEVREWRRPPSTSPTPDKAS